MEDGRKDMNVRIVPFTFINLLKLYLTMYFPLGKLVFEEEPMPFDPGKAQYRVQKMR
jgi:hypothetical protein